MMESLWETSCWGNADGTIFSGPRTCNWEGVGVTVRGEIGDIPRGTSGID